MQTRRIHIPLLLNLPRLPHILAILIRIQRKPINKLIPLPKIKMNIVAAGSEFLTSAVHINGAAYCDSAAFLLAAGEEAVGGVDCVEEGGHVRARGVRGLWVEAPCGRALDRA